MAKIIQSKFHQRDWAYSSFVALPDFGVTLKDVMDDAYWGNVAAQMKVGDMIEVKPGGLTYYARLIVIDCGPVFAKVKLLEFVDLQDEAAAPVQAPIVGEIDMGKYKAERNGGWFRVVRVSDREVMKGGFRTMKAAQDWAAEHLRVTV